MKRVTSWRFHMRNGEELVGEYLGSQDGFMFVGTGDEVHRIDQRDLTHYVPAAVSDE